MKALDSSFMTPIELPSLESIGQANAASELRALDALRFFDLHKDWVEYNKSLASKYFHKISLIKLPENASHIYSTLRRSFPYLFPVIYKVPSLAIKCATIIKKLDIDGENVIELYLHAKRDKNPSLAIKCVTFISENLDYDLSTLTSILDSAVKNNWKDLIWACLIATQRRASVKTYFPALVRATESSIYAYVNKGEEFFKVAVSAFESNLHFSFSSHGLRCVFLKDFMKNFNYPQVLKEINQLMSIEALKCDEGTPKKMLDQLGFLNLSELEMINSLVENIPNKMLDNLLSFKLTFVYTGPQIKERHFGIMY